MGSIWTLKDAEDSFASVYKAARGSGPQRVAGDEGMGEGVVVVSEREFDQMLRRPKTLGEHLRDFPKLPDDAQDLFDKREPTVLISREINFD